MTGLFTTAFIAWVIYSLVKIVNRLFLSPLKSIPGPALAACTFWYMKGFNMAGRRVHIVDSLHKKYGPVVRISPDEVSIADIPSVAEIHNARNGFRKGEFYARLTRNGVHATIFSLLDPQEHKQRRKIMGGAFSGTNLAQFESLVRERIDTMFSKITRDLHKKQTVDIYKWCTLLSADTTAELAFGQDLGNLNAEKKSEYIVDLESILLIAGVTSDLPFGDSLEYLSHFIPSQKVKWVLNAYERIRIYGYQALEAYHAHMKTHEGTGKSPLLTKLIDEMDNERNLPPALVQAEISNLMIAGTDTTAITLTYILWNIIKHPQIRATLKNEISELRGDFNDTKLADLPYMKNVITESLRLYAAAAGGLPRVVPSDGRTLAGYFLPGGTTVTTQQYTLCRLPDVFRDPLKFDPARWENPTSNMNIAYMPWGGGSRTCLGQNLAMMQIRLVIALFIETCGEAKLAASCTDKSMEMENYFLVRPIGHRCEIVA